VGLWLALAYCLAFSNHSFDIIHHLAAKTNKEVKKKEIKRRQE